MAKTAIDPMESSSQKRKDLVARWELYYQSVDAELKQDIDNLKDPYDSEAANKLTALVSIILGIQFQEAKTITMDWLRTKGIKQLSDAGKPGFKQGGCLAIATTASIVGAVFAAVGPLGGFTGATKATTDMIGNIASVGGNAGNTVTNFMGGVDRSKETTLQLTNEMAKTTSGDLKDASKKHEEMVNRSNQEQAQKSRNEFDSKTQINNR